MPHVQRPPRAGEAAGRQDVVGAGRVVAGRFGCPAPDEQAARVAQPGDGRLEVLVDRPRGAQGRTRSRRRSPERDPVRARWRRGRSSDVRGWPGEVRGATRRRWPLDRVRQGRVGRDEHRRRVWAVLGLRQQIGRDEVRVGGGVSEDEALGRTGGRSMPTSPPDSSLAAVTQTEPGPTIRSTRSRPASGRPNARAAIGLGATGDEHLVDPEQAGRTEDDRVDAAGPGGRCDDDALHPCHLGRDDRHHERGGERRLRRGDVAPDARDRRPAPLDLDPGNDRGRRRLPGAGSRRTGERARSPARAPAGRGARGRRERPPVRRARAPAGRRPARPRTGR